MNSEVKSSRLHQQRNPHASLAEAPSRWTRRRSRWIGSLFRPLRDRLRDWLILKAITTPSNRVAHVHAPSGAQSHDDFLLFTKSRLLRVCVRHQFAAVGEHLAPERADAYILVWLMHGRITRYSHRPEQSCARDRWQVLSSSREGAVYAYRKGRRYGENVTDRALAITLRLEFFPSL